MIFFKVNISLRIIYQNLIARFATNIVEVLNILDLHHHYKYEYLFNLLCLDTKVTQFIYHLKEQVNKKQYSPLFAWPSLSCGFSSDGI